MNRHLRTQELNVDQCDALHVKSWILSALKMRKITKEAKYGSVMKKGCIIQSASNIQNKKCISVGIKVVTKFCT